MPRSLIPGGNRLWARDVKLNRDSGTGFDPSVTVGEDGNALIAWSFYEIGNMKVYAQSLDSNGNRLWSVNMLVNSNVEKNHATWSPRRFAVQWKFYRSVVR